MDFSSQYLSAPANPPRRTRDIFYLLITGCFLVCSLVQAAKADGINVRSVDVEAVEEGYLLNADFDLELTPKLLDAVSHGVSLDFVLAFDLWRSRAWWFDETLIHFQEHRRLSFVPVTRMYRLNIGTSYETFTNLKDALKALAHVHAVTAAEKQALMKGQRYEASLSLGLDTSLLPKPLQIESLSTGDWQLSSPVHRFTVNPN